MGYFYDDAYLAAYKCTDSSKWILYISYKSYYPCVRGLSCLQFLQSVMLENKSNKALPLAVNSNLPTLAYLLNA